MHGNRLRDIFPAHHAIELEIPKRIDHWLFSQLLSRPSTAGKAYRPPGHRELEPSTFELGGRSTRADRSEERTTCGGCSGRIPDRSLHLCHASVLKRYCEDRALMNSHGLDILAVTTRLGVRIGPLAPGSFHLHIRGPLVTVRGRLVHGHRLPQGSAEYTVGL
ncbi:hypothetical protein B0H65DRAFT_553912 [Neurospora tetraspora]|uniref:Uncharacterized protein n=1 Tax=Neurospora tetraspora TaxID=94610 RepID=A0AAE0JMG0_9PEZI|nr:hypothetical protein B0H65DRAFT_553912 [Neurospora tetraspora]